MITHYQTPPKRVRLLKISPLRRPWLTTRSTMRKLQQLGYKPNLNMICFILSCFANRWFWNVLDVKIPCCSFNSDKIIRTARKLAQRFHHFLKK